MNEKQICNTQTNENHWITGSWLGPGTYFNNVAGLNMLKPIVPKGIKTLVSV